MLVVICTVSFIQETATAETWTRKSEYDYSYSTGSLWWKKNYNCKVYKETQYSHYLIFYGNNKVSTGFEYKKDKKNGFTIEQTNSFSLASQDVRTINAGVEIKAAKVKFGFGGSKEHTSAASWGVSSTITRKVDKSDPVGYYSYNILMNVDKYMVSGTSEGTIIFRVPTSEAYRAIVYSKTGNYNNATKDY